jgi:hypothetical protein
MVVADLAVTIEQHPDRALQAFDRIESAVNLVMPGSESHKRYQGVGEVGLAAVVGRYFVTTDSYNPFDPETPDRLSFIAHNRDKHPDVWKPMDTDVTFLGGELPEGMGRFVGFALAKINALTLDNAGLSSFRPGDAIIDKGMVGLAGGRRFGGTLVSLSGLWEVHDDAFCAMFIDELSREYGGKRPNRSIDTLSEEIEKIVGVISKLHKGVEASDMKRKDIAKLFDAMHTVGIARFSPANRS